MHLWHGLPAIHLPFLTGEMVQVEKVGIVTLDSLTPSSVFPFPIITSIEGRQLLSVPLPELPTAPGSVLRSFTHTVAPPGQFLCFPTSLGQDAEKSCSSWAILPACDLCWISTVTVFILACLQVGRMSCTFNQYQLDIVAGIEICAPSPCPQFKTGMTSLS